MTFPSNARYLCVLVGYSASRFVAQSKPTRVPRDHPETGTYRSALDDAWSSSLGDESIT